MPRAAAIEDYRVTLPVGGEGFHFRLNRRPVNFGGVELDQWWMPVPSVYPTDGRRGDNFDAIVSYHRAVCAAYGAADDRSNQQVYLLAHLLPHTRTRGSRRVVRDAVLSRGGEAETDLEAVIRAGRDEELGERAFRDSVANALGPREYTDAERAGYLEAVDELLGEGCRLLIAGDAEAAVASVRARWDVWHRGRRGRHSDKLHLLDVFSYECRAALHRCYSVVWNSLVACLAALHGLSADGVRFHVLWHLGRQRPSVESPEDDFHLFCGHVFALHPAGAAFVRTETGRELIGAYLRDPDAAAPWRRLLNGLSTAAWAYAGRGDMIAEERRHGRESERDVLRAEEVREERRRGRRRLK